MRVHVHASTCMRLPSVLHFINIPLTFKKIYFKLSGGVCVRAHVHAHMLQCTCGGQRISRWSLFSSLVWKPGLNSGHQAWWQGPLFTDSPHQPIFTFSGPILHTCSLIVINHYQRLICFGTRRPQI